MKKLSRRSLLAYVPARAMEQFTPPPPAPAMTDGEQDHAIRKLQGAYDILVFVLGLDGQRIKELESLVHRPGFYSWWQERRRRI